MLFVMEAVSSLCGHEEGDRRVGAWRIPTVSACQESSSYGGNSLMPYFTANSISKTYPPQTIQAAFLEGSFLS